MSEQIELTTVSMNARVRGVIYDCRLEKDGSYSLGLPELSGRFSLTAEEFAAGYVVCDGTAEETHTELVLLRKEKARADALEVALAGAAEANANLVDNNADLRSGLDAVEARAAALEAEVQQLRAERDAAVVRVDALEPRLAALEAGVARLDGEADITQRACLAVSKTVDALAATVNARPWAT